MAPHSSTPAWKIPWMEGPGGLQSMGSLRVRHDWATSLSLFTFMHLEKEMATHSSFLAWRIPETEEPGRRPSMGSHDWSDLAVARALSLGNIQEHGKIGLTTQNLLPQSILSHSPPQAVFPTVVSYNRMAQTVQAVEMQSHLAVRPRSADHQFIKMVN